MTQSIALVRQDMIDSLLAQTNSRRALIAKAGILGAGATAAMMIPRMTVAQDGTPADAMAEEAPFETPIDVLNYALTLEHLESAFYRDGLAAIGEAGITGLGFDASVFAKLTEIGAHEADHVTTLTNVITELGGEPVAEATYDFGYSDAQGFLQVAQALEDTGVSAYQGAAQYAMADDGLLTAALTIHGVEARHAAYIAILNGGNPFPEAVNPTLTPAEVLEIATPFITG